VGEDLVARWVLAIADDLTGALEVGAKFAGAVVTTEPVVSRRPDSPVLVVDTETRHLAPDEAADVVLETVLSAWEFAPDFVYKKTDSTLRGNIAAELRALMSVYPERPLVYAPAYPDMGRTVRDGHLFVHGVPVHRTPFAADPLNPVYGSSIIEMLEDVAATVLDGELNADIEAAALDIVQRNPPPLAAGPASLAGSLARCLNFNSVPLPLPKLRRCLIVNGSLHPASAAQIAFARASGTLDTDWVCCDRNPRSVLAMLAEASYDALIVFGGDTAFGIHRALGARDFHTYGEVVAGVPLSRRGDLFWVTKAGGFGAPELLYELRRQLT
jgi:D-threonate/D-erythronate kinase